MQQHLTERWLLGAGAVARSRERRTIRAIGLAAGLLSTLTCRSTGSIDPRVYVQGRREAETLTAADPVRVTFLGTQGFLIQWQDRAILTAPLYSNPSLGDLLRSKPIFIDTAEIERQLPTTWVKDVDAILVGHSHYDHLMDVPHIALNKATRAKVYGSETMKHLIAPAFPGKAKAERLISLSPKVDYRMCPDLKPCNADNHGQEGDTELVGGNEKVGTGVRVRALCSKHSPQFARLPPRWQGCEGKDREMLPRIADEWLLGDTLAYLIDFLDDGKPVFRIYYQDSPTQPKLGYVHESLIQAKAVDLDLLCAGAFDQVDDNPEGIIGNTRPRYILFGHWDDFFRPQSRGVRSLPATDLRVLVRRTECATAAKPAEGRWWLPAPGTVFVFPVKP